METKKKKIKKTYQPEDTRTNEISSNFYFYCIKLSKEIIAISIENRQTNTFSSLI